jgi:hypothetical protein
MLTDWSVNTPASSPPQEGFSGLIERITFHSVKFQQRYANSHRIFHNLLSLKGFGNFAAPEIDRLNRADNQGVPPTHKPLARKGFGKRPCRFWYLCWNLTHLRIKGRESASSPRIKCSKRPLSTI